MVLSNKRKEPEPEEPAECVAAPSAQATLGEADLSPSATLVVAPAGVQAADGSGPAGPTMQELEAAAAVGDL